jgi:cytochrome P450
MTAPHEFTPDSFAVCPMQRARLEMGEADTELWMATSHETVTDVMRHPAVWVSRNGQGPAMQRNAAGMLAAADQPEHTWHRRLVQKSFTPAAIAALEPRVQALCDDLIGAIGDAERFDLHDAVAYPLPVIVIAEMLGVSPDDRATFKHWSDELVASLGRGVRPPADLYAEYQAYFFREIAWRRDALAKGAPIPDDLVSGLVAHDDDHGRRLDDAQVMGMIGQMLVAGNETTTSLITNCVWRLLEQPELYAQVRDTPGLEQVAIEESLRFDPPVLGLFRTNDEPVCLGGIDLAPDTKVMAMYASANRDPAVWEHAAEFRLDRDLVQLRQRHYGFGAGIHICLGAALARLEGRVALRTIVDRFPSLKLDGETTRIDPFFLWGRRSLPVRRA